MMKDDFIISNGYGRGKNLEVISSMFRHVVEDSNNNEELRASELTEDSNPAIPDETSTEE